MRRLLVLGVIVAGLLLVGWVLRLGNRRGRCPRCRQIVHAMRAGGWAALGLN